MCGIEKHSVDSDFGDEAFLQSVNRSLSGDKLDKRMNKIVL